MPPRNRTITAKRETVTGEVTLTETTTTWEPEAWARLTAPLQHYAVPVIFTPAMRAAADEWQDEYRSQAAEDHALLDEWHAQARLAVFGPCRDPLLRQAAIMPAMLP